MAVPRIRSTSILTFRDTLRSTLANNRRHTRYFIRPSSVSPVNLIGQDHYVPLTSRSFQKAHYSFDHRVSGGWITEHVDEDVYLGSSAVNSKPLNAKMGIMHIVMFEFKPTVPIDQIEKVCKAMLALPQNCRHPKTGELYLTSHSGGRNNSPEGLAVGGFSHAFVCEFQNDEDRQYYLKEDPAHLAFVASLDGLVQNVKVVDFERGVL